MTQTESLSDASIQATTANKSVTIKHDHNISFLLLITKTVAIGERQDTAIIHTLSDIFHGKDSLKLVLFTA